MKNVVICGDGKDRRLTLTIADACIEYGGALVLDGKSIIQTCSEPAFCITSVSSPQRLACPGVIVFGQELSGVSTELDTGTMLAVTDSSNAAALSILKRCASPVIGCSMSGYDTVSLSCADGPSKLVCLQRSVITISGQLIEPCEISLKAPEDIPVYPLLAACSVLMLHDIPHEDGYRLRTHCII